MSTRRNAMKAFRCIISKAKVGVGIFLVEKRMESKEMIKRKLKT